MTTDPEEQQPAPVAEEPTQPIELQMPNGVSAFARALYRKYDVARAAGRDEECFNIVCQLLKESPQDETLSSLSRFYGKSLYKQAATALPAVLATGNLAQITQLVHKLRQMASEDELSGLVGYRDASERVDAAERKHWHSMMLSALCKMRETSDLRAREDLALSIEMFAQEKRLTFTPEQTALIARVHEDWCRFCRMEKIRAEYGKELSAFRAIEKKITLRQDLPHCELELHTRHQATSELKELHEAADLLELIEAQQKKVRTILTAQHRRMIIIRTAACIVASIILLTIAAIVFAYMRAGSLKDSITSGMEEKRVMEVSDLVGGIDPMRGFCQSVHSGYTEALVQADHWLKNYNSYQAQIAAIVPELSEATDMLTNPEVSAAELTAGLVLVDKVRKVEEKLKAEYNTTANKEATILMGKFYDRLAEIRPRVLARFSSPSAEADLDTLKALYAEFLSCTSLLNVTDDEAAIVRAAMQQRAAACLHHLSRLSLEPQQAQSAVDTFDRYADSLPLLPELRADLAAYADQVRAFAALPETLRSVSNLTEFVAALEACRDCYATVPQAITPDEVMALNGKEDAAMRAFKLADFQAVQTYPIAADQILPNLQAVKSMYAEGASVFTLARPERMDALIDRMLSDRNNVWKNGLKRAAQDSSIYIGTVSTRGKKTVMTLSNGNGTPGRRKVNLREAAVKELIPVVLAGQRQAMGFVREDLAAGKLTPARLMHNIARHPEPGCPEQARAYMFGMVVQMAELLDPYSSGLAFSESMRNDIAAYKSLIELNSLYPGCWFVMHSSTVDKRWREFFEQVASHDYYAEILNAVLPITDSTCAYAGYVSTEGKAVRCKEGDERLYFIKDGLIVPYEDSAERPYTPLFIVTLPQ